VLERQLFWIADGAEIGNAKVPVGRSGRPVGEAVRGVASNVVVIVVTTILCLFELVRTEVAHREDLRVLARRVLVVWMFGLQYCKHSSQDDAEHDEYQGNENHDP